MAEQSTHSDDHQTGWGDLYDRGMSPWSQLLVAPA
jgi:hypothetical protein